MKNTITEPVNRTAVILQVSALEQIEPSDDGVFLNEGYQFELNGSIPQVADGIAKLALAMDDDKELGDKGGAMFIELIGQYYMKARETTKEE